jgi:hypothetical protein
MTISFDFFDMPVELEGRKYKLGRDAEELFG